MNIEILCTGTELLMGKVNTDDAYLCERLLCIGLAVNRVITVGDSKSEIKSAFEESVKRSDIVFTVGGLGPTFDDLTREVVAEALKKKLIFNREIMHQIASHFAARDMEMPAVNDRQAYIMEGAEVIPNKTGTAPGMIVQYGDGKLKKMVILLPGPPSEMNPMVDDYVMKYLKKRYERAIIKTTVLHVCGLSESAVYEKIRDIVDSTRELDGNELNFAMLASSSVVQVKIIGKGADELLIDSIMGKTRQEIYDRLGNDIYGENDDTLEEVIGKLLGKKKLSLSLAESCTGGMICDRVTNIPGSSIYFKQGVVTYSNESKIRLLKVNEDTIKRYGAVSENTAKEMAVGVRKLSGVDIGMATTGIAGPTGATEKKPVGLVYVAIACEKDVYCREYRFTGHRLAIKEKVTVHALDFLRRILGSGLDM